VRWSFGVGQTLLLVGLIVIGLGPILWLAKSAITPTNDTISHPMALFPHGFAWDNLRVAWSQVHVGRYFWNTIVIALGSWFTQLLVATTAGYALSVLRPKYARFITGLLLTTLFVPAVVLLVPLYIEIVHPPLIHHSFIDSYWAIWLPAGASAFNVIIVKRFFDNLPREIFEAARIDGAGPFRLFYKIVLPMSRPILGVVSVFAVLASWKDFLWPLLVLSDPNKQPLSVRLPTIQSQTELGVFLAAMFIACLVPIAGFLIFQRSFLRGTGLGGAIKG
jgi:multiple sugar transport system permease protein